MVDTSIVNGIINQLITWGAPPCSLPVYAGSYPFREGFFPALCSADLRC